MNEQKPTSRAGCGNRLWSLTYGQIAEWAGLKVSSVRSYAQRGEFAANDIESVLRWCNRRRSAKGLSLIGQPSENTPPNSD